MVTGLADCEDIASRVAIEPTWFSAEGSHDQLHQKSLEILNAIKYVIFYMDRISFETERLTSKELANEFITAIQGNMDRISNMLNGRPLNNDPIHYPVIDELLPDSFRDTAKGLEDSQKHFFSITSAL